MRRCGTAWACCWKVGGPWVRCLARQRAQGCSSRLLAAGETDLVAAQATVACELHHAFGYFSWTGFYRVTPASGEWLVVGPYQGTLGCLRIRAGRGVCGACAAARQPQLVPDVHAFPGHIACDSGCAACTPPLALSTLAPGAAVSAGQLLRRTQSEVVVPVLNGRRPAGDLLGVLDVDSQQPAAFTQADMDGLRRVCSLFAAWRVDGGMLDPQAMPEAGCPGLSTRACPTL